MDDERSSTALPVDVPRPRVEGAATLDLDAADRGLTVGNPQFHQTLLEQSERRRDAAEEAWLHSLEVVHALRTTDWSTLQSFPERLAAAEDRAGAARERFEAAVDRLASAHMLRRAYVDQLTGTLTRGVGEEHLRHEVARAHRAATSLLVAFVDVDGLKRINDTHGHAAGDEVLQAVGLALRESLRPYDIVVRFGGDEFACAMPHARRLDVERRLLALAEHLRHASRAPSITVGLAELLPEESLDDVLRRADQDLYERRSHARAAHMVASRG